MRKFAMWSGIVLLVIFAGIVIVRAQLPRRAAWRHRGPMGFVARRLDLTSTQKSQIQSIWLEERPAVASLVREFSNEGKEMQAATASGNFDQSKIEEIANRQGATVAKLLVEKERLLSRIYTGVLTPDQRAKADGLQERMRSRLDRMAERMERTGN